MKQYFNDDNSFLNITKKYLTNNIKTYLVNEEYNIFNRQSYSKSDIDSFMNTLQNYIDDIHSAIELEFNDIYLKSEVNT